VTRSVAENGTLQYKTMDKEKLKAIREHYNSNARPVIVELEQTCSFAPSRWKGKTLERDPVMIRYRFGLLQLEIGGWFELAMETSGTQSPSHLSESDMKKKLKNMVHFNE